MDNLILARLQFAITTVYHFFFVPLTLGLSILVAVMETQYVRTGDETYKKMAKFWGKLFLINFAMGVVTGIVQEFQFGMNWSEYSRYVGDIFGVPLAIEALLAFFLESTFLGVWIFGWDKLPKKLHAVTIWLVAVGANISALWILIANSFMQEPVGYEIVNGRAQLVDFWALITNPNLGVQYLHVFLSGLATAGFFVLGISAYHILKNREDVPDFFRRSFTIASIAALIASFGIAVNGHLQGQHMVRTQPMKMAAAEALWESEDPAGLSLFTITNQAERRNIVELPIPALLSLLSYNRFSGEVKGINNLEAEFDEIYGADNYTPSIMVIFWSFRIMVGMGGLMALLSLVSVWMVWKKKIADIPLVLKILPFAIAAPYIANTTGWLMTEMGRQPWIVYGLQKTADAISPNVTSGALLFSLISFAVLYGALMAVDIYLLVKNAKELPVDEPSDDDQPVAAAASAQGG